MLQQLLKVSEKNSLSRRIGPPISPPNWLAW